jgi:RND family efflux transporter MFP subunit
VRVNAYPDRTFEGRVSFVYPSLDPRTRTAQLRIEMPNPDNLLKPAMYANVEIAIPAGSGPVLTVPTSAVIRSGTRELVLVQVAEGRFEPRPVKLGMQGDQYVQVLEGLADGEQAVVSANFLIDAESNLRAALSSFAVPDHTRSAPAPSAPAAPADHHGHAGH